MLPQTPTTPGFSTEEIARMYFELAGIVLYPVVNVSLMRKGTA